MLQICFIPPISVPRTVYTHPARVTHTRSVVAMYFSLFGPARTLERTSDSTAARSPYRPPSSSPSRRVVPPVSIETYDSPCRGRPLVENASTLWHQAWRICDVWTGEVCGRCCWRICTQNGTVVFSQSPSIPSRSSREDAISVFAADLQHKCTIFEARDLFGRPLPWAILFGLDGSTLDSDT